MELDSWEGIVLNRETGRHEFGVKLNNTDTPVDVVMDSETQFGKIAELVNQLLDHASNSTSIDILLSKLVLSGMTVVEMKHNLLRVDDKFCLGFVAIRSGMVRALHTYQNRQPKESPLEKNKANKRMGEIEYAFKAVFGSDDLDDETYVFSVRDSLQSKFNTAPLLADIRRLVNSIRL